MLVSGELFRRDPFELHRRLGFRKMEKKKRGKGCGIIYRGFAWARAKESIAIVKFRGIWFRVEDL
jgi:hypothetical protein